jgi:hypothetical protein
VRTTLTKLSPGGTAEDSPGRESWVGCPSRALSISEIEVPRITSWGIFSRPCGTVSLAHANPGLRPGPLSAVPTGLNFERVVLTQTLPNCAHVLATGPPGLASMAICAVSFLSQIAIGKSVPSTASRDRRDDKLEGGPLAWAEGGWTDSTNQDLHTYPDCPLTLSIRRLNRSMQRFFT